MSTPATSSTVPCWGCQQPVNPAAAQCLWCGAARPGARQSEGAIPSALPPSSASTPERSAGATSYGLPLANTAIPAATVHTQSANTATAIRVDGSPPLPAAFVGRHAGTGARIGAFTIDVLCVLAVVAAVYFATGTVVFALVATLECLVFLWVLEARTGLSPGNALLRIRASRADAPMSPGIGRSAARFALTGAGFLVGIVGAWVIVASSAWDGQRRRRGWADLATDTMTVTPPRALPGGRLPGMPAAAIYQEPHVEHAAPAPAPGLIERPVQVVLDDVDHADSPSASRTVPPIDAPTSSSAASSAALSVPAPPPAPVANVPTNVAPEAPPLGDSAPATGHGELLLVFDTGQREQVQLPVGVVLGRNPSPIEPTDRTIVVADPEKSVSRTHLRIEHSRGRTWVTDNDSANGTELIDEMGTTTKLAPHTRVPVEDGMRVRIGSRAFSINVLTDRAANGGLG